MNKAIILLWLKIFYFKYLKRWRQAIMEKMKSKIYFGIWKLSLRSVHNPMWRCLKQYLVDLGSLRHIILPCDFFHMTHFLLFDKSSKVFGLCSKLQFVSFQFLFLWDDYFLRGLPFYLKLTDFPLGSPLWILETVISCYLISKNVKCNPEQGEFSIFKFIQGTSTPLLLDFL